MDLHLKVRKRDGTVEPWSYDKVLNSIVKSGLTLDQADNVILILEAWARNSTTNNIVNSIDIRDKVIEIVRTVDPIAADTYQIYKK